MPPCTVVCAKHLWCCAVCIKCFGARPFHLLLPLLQGQLESASRAAKEYEQAALESDSRLREVSRQALELQFKCEELSRKCEAADQARQLAEEQGKQQLAAAEVGKAGWHMLPSGVLCCAVLK